MVTEDSEKVRCQSCGLPRNRVFALTHPCSACGEPYTESTPKKELSKTDRIQMELELGAKLKEFFADIIYS